MGTRSTAPKAQARSASETPRRGAANLSTSTLGELSDAISQAVPVRLAILFGSAARGALRPDSDIDIAVASEHPLEGSELLRIVESVALVTGRPVDVVDLRRAGDALLRQALVGGRLLFCSDRNLLTELRMRMILAVEDFAPLRRRLLDERRRAWIGT